jgi:maleylacetate reductase
MTVRPFVYDALPGRVVFASGSSRTRLAEEVDRLGVHRLLLIATVQERPLAEELAAVLGDRVVGVFDEVRPHVPNEVAESARATASELRADALLSIGGGSTTGTAKIIALETALPIVAVPTTYAGSEMTPVWGMTTAARKETGVDRRVLPKVVVYDPDLTYSLPAFITGPSAINAMAHCVEAFYAPGANPITSLMAEEGIRALARGVPVAVSEPENPEGRADTLYGAYLAGAAFAVAGSAIHHKICHVLGGAYDLPHADLHTVVLPHATAYNAEALPEVMERVSRALGASAGVSAAEAIQDLARRIGAPTALRDIGMREEDLDEAVGLVLEKIPADNPRPVDEASIRALLENAFAGRAPEAAPAAATTRSA